MKLGELNGFLGSNFDVTIDGRHYSVPPVAWETYLGFLAVHEHMAGVAAGTAKAEDGPEDQPISKMAPVVLGPVLGELIADGMPGPKIMLIARAAYLWQLGEDEIARAVLEGKADAPTSTSTTPTGSTGTAAGSTTRRRASTSGTTSQKKSQPQSVPNLEPQTA